MKKIVLSLFLGLTVVLTSSSGLFSSAQEKPLTTAESSGYTATSTYDQVMSFIKEIQKLSPFIKVETLCLSSEGREIPLLVIGNPPPASPSDLRQDDRAFIYIQANIHAGEVEGKEAALMIAREILTNQKLAYLDDLIILICPIFNADGNEKISPDNRRNQVGPEQGVGIRYNGQNLDLNRDGIKLASPEVRGLIRNVLGRWDPILTVDLHTTNGSYHIEPVTYSWQLNPNSDGTLRSFMSDEMMPAVDKILEEKYNVLSIPYGNFMDVSNPEKGWTPSYPGCRYLTNYIGLRNRLTILDENYVYADFKTRVWGCYHFLLSILDYCTAHKEDMVRLIKEADKRTLSRGMNPGSGDRFGTAYDVRPLKEPVTLIGWEMKVTPRQNYYPKVEKTDVEKTYTMPYYAEYFFKESVAFPAGYLIPLHDAELIEKLIQHGIIVEKLLEPADLEVQSYKVTEIKTSGRIYQGHRTNNLSGEYSMETRTFPAGTYYVGTAQILGTLAAYLLEPQSDDGLAVWNFFDKYLVPQWGPEPQIYPVYRLLRPAVLVKKIIEGSGY